MSPETNDNDNIEQTINCDLPWNWHKRECRQRSPKLMLRLTMRSEATDNSNVEQTIDCRLPWNWHKPECRQQPTTIELPETKPTPADPLEPEPE